MWHSEVASEAGGRVLRVSLLGAGERLTWSRVIELWQRDAAFVAFFIDLLAAAPWQACFWETPPVTRTTLGRPFECVLVDAPSLAGVPPDVHAFAEHFVDVDATGVVTFPNLGGDADLVVPCPPQGSAARGSSGDPERATPRDDVYAHLLAFTRGAPAAQQQALWRAVGAAVEQRLSDRPTWVSTSGLGIYWLHVRLDAQPKYYTYAPYRAG